MITRMSVVALSVIVLWMGVVASTATQDSDVAESATVVTFHKDVLPILQQRCENCHRPGQIGPFSVRTYQDARPWARAIKAAVVSRKMPPWFANPAYGHFSNDRSLDQSEIDTIVAWVDHGAPAGDPKDAPAPMEWSEGGFIIEPDVAFEIPPFEVPATGVIEWVRVAFPAPFDGDTWVTSVEILPGAPAVVHHMCMALVKREPTRPYNLFEWVEIQRDDNGVALRDVAAGDGDRDADGARNDNGFVLSSDDYDGDVIFSRKVGSTEVTRRVGRSLVQHGGNQFCYLPGLQYEDYRTVDAGMFVPAGSDMTVSLHYTPIGLAVTDRSKIGFTVTKEPPAKRVLHQGGDEFTLTEAPVKRESRIRELAIPPYESRYVAPTSVTEFLRDVELVWFRPHAHQRGKTVRYTLIYPDGRKEIVLDVPEYDFNWQLTYFTSLKIPKGSRIETEFTYDNSTANRFNPNPRTWVYYGMQSWEEMGTPNMGYLVENDLE